VEKGNRGWSERGMILGVWEVAFRGWIYQQEDGKTLFIEQHLVHFPEGEYVETANKRHKR
jgi:hypothetical protein